MGEEMGLSRVQDQPTCHNMLQGRYSRMNYLLFSSSSFGESARADARLDPE
jgi:hypothetical protein